MRSDTAETVSRPEECADLEMLLFLTTGTVKDPAIGTSANSSYPVRICKQSVSMHRIPSELEGIYLRFIEGLPNYDGSWCVGAILKGNLINPAKLKNLK